MDLFKKILIIIVIILFIYIVCRLLKSRVKVEKEISKENFSLFSDPTQNELNKLINSKGVIIQNSDNEILPLKEYCIKSSYNTALTGNHVNLDMIKYVISRGCRFLDFEVFYIGQTTLDINNNSITTYTPQVAYSTDSTYTTINTENSILLDKVLTTVISNAFSSTCTNPKDPIFINLRIKSKNTDIYRAVAASIDNTIRERMYLDTDSTDDPQPAKKVTNETVLSDINGKIIVCIDKTIVRNYKDYASCKLVKGPCYDLTNYINIETGSEDLNLIRYSDVMDQCVIPIKINDDNITTNVKTIKYVVPNSKNDNTQNPDISDFVLKYSAQISAFRFYINDSQLYQYEEFFDDNGSAFVPIAIAIPYFQKLSD